MPFRTNFKLKQFNLLLVFSLCCVLAYFLLPQPYRHYVLELRKFTIVLELGIMIYLLTSFNKLRRHYKSLQLQFPDPAFNIRDSITQIMGNRLIYRFAATELIFQHYGFIVWGREKQPLQDYESFTVHKESGYLSVWIALVAVIVIETAALHFFLYKWSFPLAITLTVLSIYGLFVFISDLNAIVKRPVIMNQSTLILRIGYRWRCIIAVENISSAELVQGEFTTTDDTYMGAILKSSSNVRINFINPVNIDKLSKSSFTVSSIIMNIDQRDDFIKKIAELHRF